MQKSFEEGDETKEITNYSQVIDLPYLTLSSMFMTLLSLG